MNDGIFDILIIDHRKIEDLFCTLEQARDRTKRRLLLIDLKRLCSIHIAIEEQYYYSFIYKTNEFKNSELEQELFVQDKDIFSKLIEFEEISTADDNWETDLSKLKSLFYSHFQEEERLFEETSRLLEKRDLISLKKTLKEEISKFQ